MMLGMSEILEKKIESCCTMLPNSTIMRSSMPLCLSLMLCTLVRGLSIHCLMHLEPNLEEHLFRREYSEKPSFVPPVPFAMRGCCSSLKM